MSRQPKAGEWWFSPDGKRRLFCVGDVSGFVFAGQSGKFNPSDVIELRRWVHVPDCDGWDWKLTAMPEGYELCGPPMDAVGCEFMNVLRDEVWCYCYKDYIGDGSFAYCRPVKPVFDPGPQKQPSSVARIAAQLRQITKELEELKVSDG